MNRFLVAITAVALGGLLLFAGITALVFTHELQHSRDTSEHRMRALADHVAFYCEKVAASPDGPFGIAEYLRQLTQVSGFERIAVVDSLGLVKWSSNPILQAGNDIRPYLLDGKAFDGSMREGVVSVSPPLRIEGLWFRSLYYPFRLGGEQLMVVIDSDQEYFAHAQRLRDSVLLLGVSFVVAAALLVAMLVVVSGRELRARRTALRNERLAFLGRVSAELAHELKNPLAILKSSVDILLRSAPDDSRRTPLAFMSEEIMRLSRLIGDMLSFSREEPSEFQEIDISETVRSYVSTHTAVLGSVEVDVRVPVGLMAPAAPGSMIQILDNLVRNAVTAMGGSGAMTVSFEEHGAEARLIVTDTGPGIDRKLARRLFEPFVTGSKTGIGLGLAIVRQLCERNRWRIALRSATPASFVITIPGELWRRS